jgi:hypothetical protein
MNFDRSSAATHESAHTICCHALGVPVTYTRIAREGTVLANVIDGGFAGGYSESENVGGIRGAAVLLAGAIAQGLNGESPSANARADISMLESGITEAEIQEATAMATKAITANQRAVAALADILLVKGYASGEESQAIFDRHKKSETQKIAEAVGQAVAKGIADAIAAMPEPSPRSRLKFEGVAPSCDMSRDPFARS